MLQPIPFLGFAMSLAAFPLALRIGFYDLFFCELVNIILGFALRFEIILFQVYSMLPFVESTVYLMLWIIILPPVLLAGSAGAAFFMKVLSRFTPKKLRFVVNGI